VHAEPSGSAGRAAQQAGRYAEQVARNVTPAVATASIQHQARALGEPTRHQIFLYVFKASQAVDVAELTEAFHLHHNAVRQHLAKLREAGLVLEEVESRDKPGRPRLRYRPHPRASGAWGTPGPYERLALLLAAALRNGQTAHEVGREAGRRDGRQSARGADPLDALEVEMDDQGFEPTRRNSGRDLGLVFQRCPFQTVAIADPSIVCELHLGLIEGVAERLGGLEVASLSPHDPRRGGCVLRLRRDQNGK
jgi:predicted ArsR family transcriptional regulator